MFCTSREVTYTLRGQFQFRKYLRGKSIFKTPNMYWVLYLREYFLLTVLENGIEWETKESRTKKKKKRNSQRNKQSKNRRMRCRLMISDVS